MWRKSRKREGKMPYETDCIFEEVRSAVFCMVPFKNRIPFEVMLFFMKGIMKKCKEGWQE